MRQSEWSDVGIIVVNWNNYQDTADCLESLEDIVYPNYRVVVVDNGSTDGSGKRLANQFEWCDYVFNDENLGFGGGCNSGISFALSRGMDYVFLLNNDAVVEKDFLREIVSVAEESDASVVGASVKDESGAVINSSPSVYPDMFFYSGYRENLPFRENSGGNSQQSWWDSDRVEGAGVLLPRDLLVERRDTVGYFLDDSLFMYGEEIELTMWCRERDKRSVIAEEAVVYHQGDGSSDRPFQLYYLTRNRVLIAHRYLSGGMRLVFDVLYPLTRLALTGRYLGRDRPDVAKAILLGLFDGYREIEGKRSFPPDERNA